MGCSFRVGKPILIAEIANNYVPGTGVTIVPWDVVYYEEGDIELLVDGSIEVGKPGTYLIETGVGFNQELLSSVRLVQINHTGKVPSQMRYSTTQFIRLQCQAVARLAAGDQVSARVRSDGAVFNQQHAHLSVTRIGPERWT